LMDDRADAFALAVAALVFGQGRGEGSVAVPPVDVLAGVEQEGW
jgi:hypothetical protein